jgi:hypothetical protein
MFISVRKYRNVTSVAEVRRRVEEEFLPQLKRNPGFLAYHLIDCNSPESGNILTAIGVFDNWESVLASNAGAKDFVRHRLADLLPEPADAVGGEVILSAGQVPSLAAAG